MFDYSEARATAEAIIGEFGEEAFIVKPDTEGGYDPETGDPIAGQPGYEIKGLVSPLLDYDTITQSGASEADGGTVLSGDKFCFFHSTEEPEIGMVLTVNGRAWRVVSIVDLTSVGGVNVFRKLQLRR